MKQNQKNEKFEENMKHLIGKTSDLENRSQRDNLRIIGLPEHQYKRKKAGYHPSENYARKLP